MAETRINTECFLPVREGVSLFPSCNALWISFPPCTGGCIGRQIPFCTDHRVSSLYGRVYHEQNIFAGWTQCFLPVREGVSESRSNCSAWAVFPPCTGGCIRSVLESHSFLKVSSLYGRVYRNLDSKYVFFKRFLPVREGVSENGSTSKSYKQFPPCTGGCIEADALTDELMQVSSLYGRVYRLNLSLWESNSSFLPVWEGVSKLQ